MSPFSRVKAAVEARPRVRERRTGTLRRAGFMLSLLSLLITLGSIVSSRPTASALGPGEGIDVRRVRVGSFDEDPRPKAAQRIAWEVRKRTSIETALEPTVTRFDD